MARLSGQTGVVLANRCFDRSPFIDGFSTESELKNLLISKQKKMPLILAVNVYGPAFHLQKVDNQNGWHSVTIRAIAGDSVFVGNEWGRSKDGWVKLKDLFDATRTECR